MKTRIAALFLAFLTMFYLNPSLADDGASDVRGISVETPWSRATAAGESDGVVFMRLLNTGDNDDKLILAHTDIAQKTEIYNSSDADDSKKPQEVATLPVQKRTKEAPYVELGPDHAYIKLIGLKEPLVAGQVVPLTLFFLNADPVAVNVAIYAPDAAGPWDHSGADLQGDEHEDEPLEGLYEEPGEASHGEHGGEHGAEHGGQHGAEHGADHGADHGGAHAADHGGAPHGDSHGHGDD